MNSMRRVAAAAVAVLIGTAGAVVAWPAAPASAQPWAPGANNVSNDVNVAANLNDTAVVFVNLKGVVEVTRPAAGGSTEIGQPVDLAGVPERPTQLATSAGVVFALISDGVYRWMSGPGWQRLGGPAATLFASRDGTYVATTGGPVFMPYLYTIDAANNVRRNDGIPGQWTDYGTAKSLAEVGMTPGRSTCSNSRRAAARCGSGWRPVGAGSAGPPT